MGAGKYRELIAIEDPGDEQTDTYGDPAYDWQLVGLAWAAIRPLKGRERIAAAAVQAEGDVVIEMPWAPWMDSITAKQRVLHQRTGAFYNITAPPANVDMRNREVQLTCSFGVNEG